MLVACSTLSFGKHPLEKALRIISELEFNKVDVAVHEQGPHLRPTEVAKDVLAAVHCLRGGHSLTPVAFGVEIAATEEQDYRRLFTAMCRLARMSSAPVLTIPAAAAGTSVTAEVRRLAHLLHQAEVEGVLLAVETRIGTLTEFPAGAIELCERVAGLGLALDPSHYIAGPNQGKNFDAVFPFVRHMRLRDTGRSPEQFQVRIGQGEIEYSRLVSLLARCKYDRALTVDIRDIPDAPFAMAPEVRKLKYLLESVV